MHLTRTQLSIGAGLFAIILGAFVVLRGKPAQVARQPRGSAVQVVKTGLAEQRSIPITVHANGYVSAINTVDVRPQVQNVVRTIHVKEGQQVRAGQLLFTLDERGDVANAEKAAAQVARDRADLADAELALKRNQELLARNFISQAVVDTARSKVEALRSTLRADAAGARSSNVALGYNRISASIDGRIGAISVHPGSLAQPAGAPMVTISQLDPITVGFTVPERDLAYVRASYPKGDAPVVVQLAGDKTMTGKLVFIDNMVDSQTGAIRMKAQFANPDHAMWPGAFVNVTLVSRTLPDAVVIPAQAIVTGPVDKFTYAVQPDNSVKMEKIEVVAIENGLAAVSGIAVGTRVVVEGVENLRPDSKIRETRATPAGAAKEPKRPA